jgi:hypothetical protein
MAPSRIWLTHREATFEMREKFGTAQAVNYLIGEKFLKFLEAAETNADFPAETPDIVAELEMIFEPWHLACADLVQPG